MFRLLHQPNFRKLIAFTERTIMNGFPVVDGPCLHDNNGKKEDDLEEDLSGIFPVLFHFFGFSGRVWFFEFFILAMRTPYNPALNAFLECDLVAREPIAQFKEWFDEVCASPTMKEPNAVALATATRLVQPFLASGKMHQHFLCIHVPISRIVELFFDG